MWAVEAAQRPKDFAGAQDGILLPPAREIQALECGPSLLAAGQWTAVRAYYAGASTENCSRCSACPETLEHRL